MSIATRTGRKRPEADSCMSAASYGVEALYPFGDREARTANPR